MCGFAHRNLNNEPLVFCNCVFTLIQMLLIRLELCQPVCMKALMFVWSDCTVNAHTYKSVQVDMFLSLHFLSAVENLLLINFHPDKIPHCSILEFAATL